MEYYSQIGQDKYVNEEIFKGMENGFFVDIGAHNGIYLSNSYFFEKYKNWNGICVEPLPDVYETLKKNRKCTCIKGAIFIENGYQEFLSIKSPQVHTEMLSGLLNEYDPRHRERYGIEMHHFGGSWEIIKVKTFTLQSILDEHNVSHIDFLSVDTEGSELAVLKSIDFKKVKIECIAVENNYQKKDVEEFLTMYGYNLVKKLDFDDVYLLSKSKFSIG